MNENLPAAYGIAKEAASMQQYIVVDYKVFLNDLAYFATNITNVDDILYHCKYWYLSYNAFLN